MLLRMLGAIRLVSLFFFFNVWAVLYMLCYMYTYANRLQSILDCSEANEGFYVKCGFKRAGLEMAHYY